MAVKHNILGEGKIIEESKINVGGFNYKVQFNNGLIRWCSREELHI